MEEIFVFSNCHAELSGQARAKNCNANILPVPTDLFVALGRSDPNSNYHRHHKEDHEETNS